MAWEKMPPIAKQESQSGLQVIGPRRDNSSEPIDVYMGRLVRMSNELPTYLSDMQVNKIRNNPGADVSWYVLDNYLLLLLFHVTHWICIMQD